MLCGFCFLLFTYSVNISQFTWVNVGFIALVLLLSSVSLVLFVPVGDVPCLNCSWWSYLASVCSSVSQEFSHSIFLRLHCKRLTFTLVSLFVVVFFNFCCFTVQLGSASPPDPVNQTFVSLLWGAVL